MDLKIKYLRLRDITTTLTHKFLCREVCPMQYLILKLYHKFLITLKHKSHLISNVSATLFYNLFALFEIFYYKKSSSKYHITMLAS